MSKSKEYKSKGKIREGTNELRRNNRISREEFAWLPTMLPITTVSAGTLVLTVLDEIEPYTCMFFGKFKSGSSSEPSILRMKS